MRNSPLFLALCIALFVGGGIGGYFIAGKLTAPAPAVSRPAVSYVSPTLSAEQLQTATAVWPQVSSTLQAARSAIFQDPWAVSADESQDSNGSVYNTEKGLKITSTQLNIVTFAVTDNDFGPDVDVSITAQALPPDPCGSWQYGLDLRQPIIGTHTGTFYRFSIQGDRIWGFVLLNPNSGEGKIFAQGTLSANVDIHQPNKLRVVAVGTHFDLYINDQHVGSADDTSGQQPLKGRVGAGVSTCSSTNAASALFTDLIVKDPRQSKS